MTSRCKATDSTWIASSFGDFTAPAVQSARERPPGGRSRKRARSDRPQGAPVKGQPTRQRGHATPLNEDELWVEKYAPLSQADLVVHKKKVCQVESWLKQSILGKSTGGSLLLLTGPSGCGKTATISVLAREMGVGLCEWTNPPTAPYTPHTPGDVFAIGGPWTESQARQFQDFLLRANKYPTLEIFAETQHQKRIVLVEDFPNNFYRDPSQLHAILRNYTRRHVCCPLVFIVSDSCSGETSSRKLFPADLQLQLKMDNISFNPVAVTNMVKVLTRIAADHESQSDKTAIDQITEASAGDIRAAINALQFTLFQDSEQFAVPTSATRWQQRSAVSRPSSVRQRGRGKEGKGGGQEDPSAIGTKDHSLFLFRALGKILYCKLSVLVLGDRSSSEVILPLHLSHHQRVPLLFSPEDVICRSHLSAELFTAYLHQNYIDFYDDFDDVVAATAYFSDADMVTADWTSRPQMRVYSGSLASRAVAFCNTGRATAEPRRANCWRPLHKPDALAVDRKFQSARQLGQSLFKEYSWTRDSLHSEILPFLAIINSPLRSQAHTSYLQDVSSFTKSASASRHRGVLLDEQEPADETVGSLGGRQVALRTVNPEETVSLSSGGGGGKEEEEEEEEGRIEEFSD